MWRRGVIWGTALAATAAAAGWAASLAGQRPRKADAPRPTPVPAPPPARTPHPEAVDSEAFRSFIFTRELAEVYLLLDNVSTDPSKTMPGAKDDPPTFIEDICRIGWPPEGGTAQRAQDAATLIRARDRLNTAVYPATGASIAFTLLCSGEDNPEARGRVRAGEPGLIPNTPARGGGEAEPPSRFSLAYLAFPNLVKPARRFQLFLNLLSIGLAVMLAATCLLSWNVALGNSMLGQWVKIADERTDLLTKLGADPTAAANTTPPPASQPVATTSTPAQPQAQAAASARCPLCRQLHTNEENLKVASANLNQWLQVWGAFQYPQPCLDPTSTEADALNPSPKCAGRHVHANKLVNEQWASTLLSVLSGGVLPVCYGLLGAGASVARSSSAKMRANLLSPRHFKLYMAQLVLGAIIGACIGLFVTPSGSSNTQGLLGSIPLSASALCFIAGFGVEGVFRALEGLVKRVFNLEEPAKPPATPARARTQLT